MGIAPPTAEVSKKSTSITDSILCINVEVKFSGNNYADPAEA
jgi:hypothetical protein